MPTECRTDCELFGPVEGRRVAADFDGGAITSDAGGLLLGSTDRAIGIEAVGWQPLPTSGRIWVYVPQKPTSAGEPGVGRPGPDAEFPLLESYVDVVVEGGLESAPTSRAKSWR